MTTDTARELLKDCLGRIQFWYDYAEKNGIEFFILCDSIFFG